MSLKRYSPSNGDKCGGEYEHCEAEMVEHPSGDYVAVDEVDDLLRSLSTSISQAVDALKAALDQLTRESP